MPHFSGLPYEIRLMILDYALSLGTVCPYRNTRFMRDKYHFETFVRGRSQERPLRLSDTGLILPPANELMRLTPEWCLLVINMGLPPEELQDGLLSQNLILFTDRTIQMFFKFDLFMASEVVLITRRYWDRTRWDRVRSIKSMVLMLSPKLRMPQFVPKTASRYWNSRNDRVFRQQMGMNAAQTQTLKQWTKALLVLSVMRLDSLEIRLNHSDCLALCCSKNAPLKTAFLLNQSHLPKRFVISAVGQYERRVNRNPPRDVVPTWPRPRNFDRVAQFCERSHLVLRLCETPDGQDYQDAFRLGPNGLEEVPSEESQAGTRTE